ncbi:uncharacterized protein LY89DRAFT_729317 [Mollisia scopiformis]|uniref:Uncharacterized protein n=1 Tax=Mollisia scopiformis TaxID=149040 RepID=A0A194XPZ6_MOLSC|nr:uncharacterized protein LY89DRAFT_729317 [Mollisia scopiformis]KUJ21817.1 hypothetical protein LY89DRAFT_729317 [Mollisia scopiformis]
MASNQQNGQMNASVPMYLHPLGGVSFLGDPARKLPELIFSRGRPQPEATCLPPDLVNTNPHWRTLEGAGNPDRDMIGQLNSYHGLPVRDAPVVDNYPLTLAPSAPQLPVTPMIPVAQAAPVVPAASIVPAAPVGPIDDPLYLYRVVFPPEYETIAAEVVRNLKPALKAWIRNDGQHISAFLSDLKLEEFLRPRVVFDHMTGNLRQRTLCDDDPKRPAHLEWKWNRTSEEALQKKLEGKNQFYEPDDECMEWKDFKAAIQVRFIKWCVEKVGYRANDV